MSAPPIAEDLQKLLAVKEDFLFHHRMNIRDFHSNVFSYR